jgi:4-amino-4-deoxy-L-arabinose transferase-like glycosyltransferase
MVLPFIGIYDFNTKGEPREAVVAMSMLNSGNWILPVNNGVDLAFKPPFFHWCIAAFSLLLGGVSEFSSRLPSAIAFIITVVSTFVFFAKRSDQKTGLIAAFITLTSFELHRAGFNCRVDIVLTACTVRARTRHKADRWRRRYMP